MPPTRNPYELYMLSKRHAVLVPVTVHGQEFEAILNTAHLVTTVSLEIGELLLQHTPIYVCKETLVADLHLRPAGVSPKPLHSPYTVWADFTAKGSQFRQPWVVVTDQILPIVLVMDFISSTGTRLLINGNLEQRREG